jgi:hypothetical protein
MHTLAGKSNVRGHKEDDARRDATSLVKQKYFETEKRDQILIQAHVWANELT